MNTDALREAIAAAIKENPAGLKGEAIAARMGVSTGALYRWGEDTAKTIPLERLIQFVLITGDLRPIAALCGLVGGVFLALPAPGKGKSQDDLITCVREFADLAQRVSEVLSDGKVTSAELPGIRKEGSEAQRAIALLVADLESQAQKDDAR